MMNKKTVFFSIILSSLLLLTLTAGDLGADEYKKLFVRADYNLLIPADENFKDVYGSSQGYPRVSAGYMLNRWFYLWGGYGRLSTDGTIPGTSFATSSTQGYLFAGLGIMFAPDRKLSFKIDAAYLNVSVKEEALGIEFSESANGFSIEGGVIYEFSKTFFLELSGGYMYARLTTNEFGSEPKVGGLRSAVGLGFRF